MKYKQTSVNNHYPTKVVNFIRNIYKCVNPKTHMKKEGKIILTLIFMSMFLLAILLSVNLVSAETNFDRWGKNIASGISNLFEKSNLGTFNFTLLLFGILTWMVIYSVIRNIGLFKNYSAIWSGIFALVVTILAFNGFPEELIESIVIQYRAMGATVVTVVPLLIIFWFTIMVQGTSLMISRVIWIVYVIYYFSLYIFKIGSLEADVAIFSMQNFPYIAAIVLGILVLIFLGPIRAFVIKEELDSKKEQATKKVDKSAEYTDITSKGLDKLAE